MSLSSETTTTTTTATTTIASSKTSLLQEAWSRSLYQPWREMDSRPRKNTRSRFVKLGYMISQGDLRDPDAQAKLQVLSEAIETLHLGSLIIDDIEDGSLERREGPSLHRTLGMPVALNLGNFLYFESFQKIREGPFSEFQKINFYELMIETFLRAHRGQALDLSVQVDLLPREQVGFVARESLRLKSGALMSLALQFGSLIAPRPADLKDLQKFGDEFGMALQMFDDISNLSFKGVSLKDLEDLDLRRPTWIWVVLAEHFTTREWDWFIDCLQDLPTTDRLENFLHSTGLREIALELARENLHQVLHLIKDGPPEALREAREISKRLGYVTA